MAYSPEELAQMPLEELESLVMQESQKLTDLLSTGGPETLPAMPPEQGMPQDPMMGEEEFMEEEIPDMTSSPIMDPNVPLDMLSPDIIQSATTSLVEAGFLDQATNAMSPDLIAVLQGVADLLSPGIYNLNTDEDLMEFVNGIANGTIPLAGAGSTSADAGAGAGAGPGPSLGAIDPGAIPPGF
tara:strand:- start:1052 stop:1603 length:552 start_codon:yes stop_codon:yes gene_type:complete